MEAFMIPPFWACALVVLAFYVVGVAVYRIYLSPLAYFPGPKLAAASVLYEFYYDIICKGQYIFKIKELHDRYGPIVRIGPNELHVNDVEFIDTLYTHQTPMNKSRSLTNMFDLHLSTFGTEKHDVHRSRRAALNPFFSKQRIVRLEPVIQNLVRRFCERAEEFARKRPVSQQSSAPSFVPLSLGLICLTTDILTEYILTESYGYLETADWFPQWGKTVLKVPEMGLWGKYIPWILPLMKSIPHKWVAAVHPGMGTMLDYKKSCEKKILEIMQDRELTTQRAQQKISQLPTLFHELLDSDVLPAQEKTFARLSDECQSVVGAGTETAAHTLEVTMFHLIDNPDKLQKLRDELDGVNPNYSTEIPLKELDSLPYLSSVILEGLRLAYGVSTRLQRISPYQALQYRDYKIPPGTAVGMTSSIIHHNESIFPDSHKFLPERWLDQADRRRLEKYLVSFSRGSRSCAGINLARAELVITLSTFFRRFREVQLYETTREDDVDMKHDFFLPRPRNLYGDGVKVLIHGL